MNLTDLTNGQKVTIDLVAGECSIRKTKGTPPRDYLAAVMTDGTEQIDCKMWNYDARKGVPETGKVYTCSGTVGEYLGKKQLTLDKFTESADQDMTRFMPHYVAEPDVLYRQCLGIAAEIKSDTIRDITLTLYTKYQHELLVASSAKGIHHVGIGGNLAHQYEVARIALAIGICLNSITDTQLSTDLLMAGGLIHDIGKCMTYEIMGATVSYTRCGMMQDHVVLGLRMFDAALNGTELYYTPEADALRHIILSHHGELEYGSPVVPLFMEAMIVNRADGISATWDTLRQANKKAESEGKAYTDKIFTSHNREHILQRDILKAAQEVDKWRME